MIVSEQLRGLKSTLDSAGMGSNLDFDFGLFKDDPNVVKIFLYLTVLEGEAPYKLRTAYGSSITTTLDDCKL